MDFDQDFDEVGQKYKNANIKPSALTQTCRHVWLMQLPSPLLHEGSGGWCACAACSAMQKGHRVLRNLVLRPPLQPAPLPVAEAEEREGEGYSVACRSCCKVLLACSSPPRGCM